MSVAVSTVVSPPLCCTRTVLVPICSPLRIMAKLAAVAPPGSCPCASAVYGPNASAATANNNVKNLHIQTSLGNVAHLAKKRFACESAWNKDPVFGVIGIQTGPRGRRVHSGFHGGHGSRFWDADSGDDCKDPAGLLCPGEADQGDLPRVSGIAEGRAQSGSVAGDRVPVQARPPAAAADRSVAQTA